MATDPAFLFYPADASEDTQFMNRLERGAYFDLLKAHKKFSRFTLEIIKKVLGRDFESCWHSIESILAKDETGYFITWVDNSIEKRKVFAQAQKDRIKNYHKRKSLESVTEPIPSLNTGTTNVQPLGNENVIGNENENEIKGGVGEIQSFEILNIPCNQDEPPPKPLNAPDFEKVIEFFYQQGRTGEEGKKVAKGFYDHYDGMGWKVGFTPIYNWRSMASKWISNNPKNNLNGRSTNSGNRSTPKGDVIPDQKDFGNL